MELERIAKQYPFLVTPLQYISILLLYVQCALIIGISAFPSVWGVHAVWGLTTEWSEAFRLLILSIAGALGYFLYAMVVIFIVAAVCFLFRLKIREGRYYIYSLEALRWANYNSLILIVRYTCMNFLRVTPFLPLFYKMMGAKIGRNVQINTTIIGDCALLEIGDDSIIGGDVTLVAHLAEGKELVIKKVKIGSHVMVGLMSIIMPGVQIGDHVTIAANSVLTKNTVVPSHTVWAGIPAREIRRY